MRTLHLPRFWPLQVPLQAEQDKQDAETTREWARCVVNEAQAYIQAGHVGLPERTLTALQRHTTEPTQVQQPTPPSQSPSPQKGPKGPSENLSKYILFCRITVNLVQISDDCSSS
jgi:hypothetical protein